MEKRTIGKIDSNKINITLKKRGESHNFFKFYSKKPSICSIIKNKCIFVSDGKNWNDENDAVLFNSEKNIYRFGICFSSYQAESVAMWMLYGGKGKTGALLDFEKKDIKTIISENIGKQVQLFRKINNKFVGLEEEVLVRDAYLYDAAYCAENRNFFVSDNDGYLVNEIKGKKEKLIVNKDYQWHYEKETRLVFEVYKNEIPKYVNIHDPLYIKINLNSIINDEFIKNRVYESPMNDGEHTFKKSKIKNIKWDLDE